MDKIKQQNYKGWQLLEKMPKGWVFCNKVGSPLHGYVFVTNGKSLINGQKRALLKLDFKTDAPQLILDFDKKAITTKTIEQPKAPQVIDAQYVRTVNDLARKKFKRQLLNDILVDLTICEIEGWCKREYIEELKKLISDLGNHQTIDA